MADSTFMQVDDVARELGVSRSYAYKIIRKLNAELKEMGYLTVAGRVSKNISWKNSATEHLREQRRKSRNGSL